MDYNAEFVQEIYQAVKASPTYHENYRRKKNIIVFDNASCHSQTESRVIERPDMVLLRLAPYSPMCNPIDGCFSVLKSRIKDHLALERSAVNSRPTGKDANVNSLNIAGHQM
ncbi:hypothetical protein ON010_g15255 [Phytophthora cinnamomi]|nr:hypothetical protein ON010_g15255 [Phytophthora cinnamomi]